VDIRKTLDYLVFQGRVNTHSFAIVRTNNNRFAGSHITVNERVAFSISNKVKKLEYYSKIHIN